MSISRFTALLLAVAMQVLLASAVLAFEPAVQLYPNNHPPVPQQASGPPQPARDRPGPGPSVGDEPPSGIDAPGPEFAHIEDMEIFAPADISTYGMGIPANTGWWASFDYLRWTVSPPKRTTIGNPAVADFYSTGSNLNFGSTLLGLTPGQASIIGPYGSNYGTQLAPVDTGFIGNGPTNGYRWEGGWMDRYSGFMLSAFKLYTNNQYANVANVGVPFYAPPQGPNGISLLQGFVDPAGLGFDNDFNGNGIFGRYGANPTSFATPQNAGAPDFGDLRTLPVNFRTLFVADSRSTMGAEADYVWRMRPSFRNNTWEFLAGARWFRWDEQFTVVGVGGVLDSSFWATRAINQMVGAQVGVRWAHRRNRLMLTSESRFMAGGNLQNIRQVGLIGSNTIPGAPPSATGTSLNLMPTGFDTAIRELVFAPLGEFRVNMQYQVFNKVSLNVGWTGIVVGNVARPSDMVNYQLPNMGIISHGGNRQVVFMEGINAGITFNR